MGHLQTSSERGCGSLPETNEYETADGNQIGQRSHLVSANPVVAKVLIDRWMRPLQDATRLR